MKTAENETQEWSQSERSVTRKARIRRQNANVAPSDGQSHQSWVKDLLDSMVLIRDARVSGESFGLVVGHVAPEAAVGGIVGLVQEGDSITVDANQLLIQLNVDETELAKRRAAWTRPEPRYRTGVLGKSARLESSSSKGAVTDQG